MGYDGYYATGIRVAIVGRNKDTLNYEKALDAMGVRYLTTMDPGMLPDMDALLLPGGGDITPAFFGQKNHGSRNIDIELDIIQLQALDIFYKLKRPVLGICKGMQVINVYFGGTIIQDMAESPRHAWENGDKLHSTAVREGSFLEKLYGKHMITNSAHHQAIDRLGRELRVIQNADDGIVEGIVHDRLPILGVQWHPERLFFGQGGCPPAHNPSDEPADGRPIFSYFLSLCSSDS